MNDLKRAVVQISFEGKKYNISITDETQKQILVDNYICEFLFLFEQLNINFHIFKSSIFQIKFFNQTREKIQKNFAPSSGYIGPMTSQVAQPCKYEFVYTTIHLKFLTNFTLEAFSEIGKGQQLAYSSGNLPSYSRGRSKGMGSSTSQFAPVCLLYVQYPPNE